MEELSDGGELPKPWIFIALVVIFLLLSLITHIQQYRATYVLVYGEVKDMRISLTERLRTLPLSFFAKHDITDLTETMLGDVSFTVKECEVTAIVEPSGSGKSTFARLAARSGTRRATR